jgi:hypothetical protein
MSSLAKGLTAAVGVTACGSLAIAMPMVGFSADPYFSDEALSAMAQIGATLLIAYAVETCWFIKESKVRGRERENWVGFVAGVGVCSSLGLVLAVALLGNGHMADLLEAYAAAWALFSLGFLAAIVALLPYVLYEWVHMIHAEYSDD